MTLLWLLSSSWLLLSTCLTLFLTGSYCWLLLEYLLTTCFTLELLSIDRLSNTLWLTEHSLAGSWFTVNTCSTEHLGLSIHGDTPQPTINDHYFSGNPPVWGTPFLDKPTWELQVGKLKVSISCKAFSSFPSAQFENARFLPDFLDFWGDNINWCSFIRQSHRAIPGQVWDYLGPAA